MRGTEERTRACWAAPIWIGGNQEKGEPPRSHSEIDNILNNLQERLYEYDNQITGYGVIIGEFAYAYFGYLKDDVLKEIPWGGLGIFVDSWSTCMLCNM